MTRRIVLSQGAARDLRRVSDPSARRRLAAAIGSLGEDPHPPASRKLAGFDGVWRIRVGGFRICYALEDDALVVLVLTVAPRSDVYERLRRRLRGAASGAPGRLYPEKPNR